MNETTIGILLGVLGLIVMLGVILWLGSNKTEKPLAGKDYTEKRRGGMGRK